MNTFEYVTKTIVNKKRAYPANRLARLFLSLNKSRGAKTFTDDQLEIIKLIADMTEIEIKEKQTVVN